MNKPLLIAPLALVAMVAVWIWVASAEPAKPPRVPIEKLKAIAESENAVGPPTATAARKAGVADGSATPKWVVDEPTYNFGTMDAYSDGSHEFVVRNEGTAPLTLKNHETSCKCTLSQVDNDEIPPGGEGRVKLEWHTVGRQQYYLHSATLKTNDPKRKFLKLQIRGQVRSFVAAEPEEIVFSSVAPGVEAEGEAIILSQSFPEFTLSDISSSSPELKWAVGPAAPEKLAELKATAGYRLKVTLPGDLPSGPFAHTLKFHVVAPNGKSQEFKMAVAGKVLRRLAVYGPEIDDQGVIELGKVVGGTALKKRLTMKVRDSQTDLVVRQIKTVPEFLKVSVTPFDRGDDQTSGLYWLNVEVPADAPDCGFTDVAPGKIDIEFDHPRVEPLALQVKLIITP